MNSTLKPPIDVQLSFINDILAKQANDPYFVELIGSMVQSSDTQLIEFVCSIAQASDAYLIELIRSIVQKSYMLPVEDALELLDRAWVAQKLLWRQR